MAVSKAFDADLRSAALAYLRAAQLRTGGPVRHQDVATFEFAGDTIPCLEERYEAFRRAG